MINFLSILIIALQILSVQVSIDPSGVVTVTMDVTVTQGVNEIQLPVQPIVESIEVTVGNESLTPIYSNGTLYVFSPVNGTAHISYLANITATNGVLEFDIVSRSLVKLVLSSNIVLLSVPTNLVNFSYIGNKLVLYLYGPQTIQYIVKTVTVTTTTITTPTQTTATTTTAMTAGTTTTTTATTISVTATTTPIPTTSITTSPATTATTSLKTTPTAPSTVASLTRSRTTPTTPPKTTQTAITTHTTTTSPTSLPITAPTSTPTTPITRASTSSHTASPATSSRSPTTVETTQIGGTPWLPGAIAAVVIVGVALGVLVALSRRRTRGSGSTVTEVLSDLDKAILAKLAEKGGSALQSELQKELGTPKTTLWRHIKKLEKLGYVEIVKEGTFNRVVLKRKP